MTLSKYEYIFALGVDVEKNSEGLLDVAKSDEGGVLLGELRLKACHELLRQNICSKLIIVGWHKELLASGVWRSEVMKKLLIENYKDDENKIEALHQIGEGTGGNIKEIKRYILEKRIDISKSAYITNFYHIPRSSLLFAREGILMKPIIAESLLLDSFEEIEKEYSSSQYSERLKHELNSIKKIQFE